MRLDHVYFTDIIESCDKIGLFLKRGRGEEFSDDIFLQSAIRYELTIIGEAVVKLSPEAKVELKDLPLDDIRALRNRLVHAYRSIDPLIIQQIVKNDLDMLRKTTEGVLARLYPEVWLELQRRRVDEDSK